MNYTSFFIIFAPNLLITILANYIMADDKKIIFSMNKVSKTYSSTNKQVLKDIYLSFFYGAKIGILGLNGSGKSSLLKLSRRSGFRS